MIYSNISQSSFQFYKQRLKEIEDSIEMYCLNKGFYILKEEDGYYEETLAININSKEPNYFEGNICLQYIDTKGSVSFSFGLIKSHDIEDYRLFQRKKIVEKCTLEYFKENAISLLERAFAEYDSISLEDMTSRVRLPPRYDE